MLKIEPQLLKPKTRNADWDREIAQDDCCDSSASMGDAFATLILALIAQNKLMPLMILANIPTDDNITATRHHTPAL